MTKLRQVLCGLFTIAALTANAQLDKTDQMKAGLTIDNIDTVAWVYNGTLNIGLNQGFLHNWAGGKSSRYSLLASSISSKIGH